MPESAIAEIMAFPGSPDAIGKWIDDAFDQVLAQFTACDGSLARQANRISGSDLKVIIMPSAFYVPVYDVLAAGAYYPTPHEIRVLNIYYTWSGDNKGWMRHARDLLVEMGNYFAVTIGIEPEPRSTGWPCNAPAVVPEEINTSCVSSKEEIRGRSNRPARDTRTSRSFRESRAQPSSESSAARSPLPDNQSASVSGRRHVARARAKRRHVASHPTAAASEPTSRDRHQHRLPKKR